MASVKKGDIIQLQRRGFFICDQPYEPPRYVIKIQLSKVNFSMQDQCKVKLTGLKKSQNDQC